jgi:hypothetical protein
LAHRSFGWVILGDWGVAHEPPGIPAPTLLLCMARRNPLDFRGKYRKMRNGRIGSYRASVSTSNMPLQV